MSIAGPVAIRWLMAPEEPDPWEYLEQLTRRPLWQSLAACRGTGPDRHFPARGASLVATRALCASCTVRSECLAYALADPDLAGVWGGTTDRERRRMRRDAKDPRSEPGFIAV